MMKGVTSSSVAWKTAKNDSATVSLKSTWKPTFEWKQDTLVLKAIPHQDVYARDAANKVQPLGFVSTLLRSLDTYQRQEQQVSIRTQSRLCITHQHL